MDNDTVIKLAESIADEIFLEDRFSVRVSISGVMLNIVATERRETANGFRRHGNSTGAFMPFFDTEVEIERTIRYGMQLLRCQLMQYEPDPD